MITTNASRISMEKVRQFQKVNSKTNDLEVLKEGDMPAEASKSGDKDDLTMSSQYRQNARLKDGKASIASMNSYGSGGPQPIVDPNQSPTTFSKKKRTIIDLHEQPVGTEHSQRADEEHDSTGNPTATKGTRNPSFVQMVVEDQ